MSSTGDNASRVSLRTGKEETAIDEKDPYYTEVRIVGGIGKIPLKNGYFEVPLPARLFEGNPQEISLRWIDFHRNSMLPWFPRTPHYSRLRAAENSNLFLSTQHIGRITSGNQAANPGVWAVARDLAADAILGSSPR